MFIIENTKYPYIYTYKIILFATYLPGYPLLPLVAMAWVRRSCAGWPRRAGSSRWPSAWTPPHGCPRTRRPASASSPVGKGQSEAWEGSPDLPAPTYSIDTPSVVCAMAQMQPYLSIIALHISSLPPAPLPPPRISPSVSFMFPPSVPPVFAPAFFRGRSEERCVGTECRSRWSPDH